jgi:hypothetical protein
VRRISAAAPSQIHIDPSGISITGMRRICVEGREWHGLRCHIEACSVGLDRRLSRIYVAFAFHFYLLF